MNIDPAWAAISVSILLGLAGIFEVRSWIYKPRLALSINLTPPDCHKIALKDSRTGEERAKVYYLRFRVRNKGNREAKDVQVMAKRLSIFDGESFQEMKSFLPLNIVWSHIGGYVAQSIPSGAFRHCDLGYLTSGAWKDALIRLYNLDQRAAVVLKMDTVTEPNTGSHIVFPGRYRLAVHVSASNAKSLEKTYELELKGAWYDSEEEMFSKSITIREVA